MLSLLDYLSNFNRLEQIPCLPYWTIQLWKFFFLSPNLTIALVRYCDKITWFTFNILRWYYVVICVCVSAQMSIYFIKLINVDNSKWEMVVIEVIPPPPCKLHHFQFHYITYLFIILIIITHTALGGITDSSDVSRNHSVTLCNILYNDHVYNFVYI